MSDENNERNTSIQDKSIIDITSGYYSGTRDLYKSLRGKSDKSS